MESRNKFTADKLRSPIGCRCNEHYKKLYLREEDTANANPVSKRSKTEKMILTMARSTITVKFGQQILNTI